MGYACLLKLDMSTLMRGRLIKLFGRLGTKLLIHGRWTPMQHGLRMLVAEVSVGWFVTLMDPYLLWFATAQCQMTCEGAWDHSGLGISSMYSICFKQRCFTVIVESNALEVINIRTGCSEDLQTMIYELLGLITFNTIKTIPTNDQVKTLDKTITM